MPATVSGGAEIAWAWYHGDSATCTDKAEPDGGWAANGLAGRSSDVCKHTPAAHADAMALAFDTYMHYGHSVARIKVQQGLAILHHDLASGSTTAPMDDLKMDVQAHLLIQTEGDPVAKSANGREVSW